MNSGFSVCKCLFMLSGIMENIVLPESGSETDTEDDSRVAPTLAPGQ